MGHDKAVIQALKKASRGWLPFRKEYEHSKYVRTAARGVLKNLKKRGIFSSKFENSSGPQYPGDGISDY